MKTVILIPEDFDGARFDACATHPIQSWAWGTARRSLGTEILRFGEFENNILVHSFTLTLHSLPRTRFRVGYLGMSSVPSDLVLDFLSKLKTKHRLVFIKIEPYVEKESTQEQAFLNGGRVHYRLVESPHSLFFRCTEFVDLTRTEDELFLALDKNVRYDIRMAAKKGVVAREVVGDAGFEIFQNLYFDTAARKNYHGHNKAYHRAIWETLSRAGQAHVVVAFAGDVPITAHMLFYFNSRLYYPYSGSQPGYREMRGPTCALWESIRLGKSWGATEFDLWGSLGREGQSKAEWTGFSDFKKGFGTRSVELFQSYDMVFLPFQYWLYTLAYFLRRWILNWKR